MEYKLKTMVDYSLTPKSDEIRFAIPNAIIVNDKYAVNIDICLYTIIALHITNKNKAEHMECRTTI